MCSFIFMLWCFKKEIKYFVFLVQFFCLIPSFLFRRSQTQDTPLCRRPQLLISPGNFLRCRSILICCERPRTEITRPHSKRHSYCIVYFVQPTYIFLSPCFCIVQIDLNTLLIVFKLFLIKIKCLKMFFQ